MDGAVESFLCLQVAYAQETGQRSLLVLQRVATFGLESSMSTFSIAQCSEESVCSTNIMSSLIGKTFNLEGSLMLRIEITDLVSMPDYVI